MSGRTSIEWTDSTWNPVSGCSKVSAGCKFCYAERLSRRWHEVIETRDGSFVDGLRPRRFTDIRLHEDRLDLPLSWRRPRRIFVCSMSDLFHEDVPWDFIARIFTTMISARHHQFQVLTKRAQRMNKGMLSEIQRAIHAACLLPSSAYCREAWPPRHVWLGTSAEDQPALDKRWPHLRDTPAAVRFLSLEPLLGPVDCSIPLGLTRDRYDAKAWSMGAPSPGPRVDWIIAGGESGGPPERALVEKHWYGDATDGLTHTRWVPKATAADWIRSIREQCHAAGVAFLFKQFGGLHPRCGGRVLDGKVWHQFPDGTGGIYDAAEARERHLA